MGGRSPARDGTRGRRLRLVTWGTKAGGGRRVEGVTTARVTGRGRARLGNVSIIIEEYYVRACFRGRGRDSSSGVHRTAQKAGWSWEVSGRGS